MNPVRRFVATRLPVLLYLFVGFGLLVQGVRYISATEIMPYHSAVIGTPWANVGADEQKLLLGLLKGFGAGSFCVGMAVTLLALIPLRSDSSWARWATPAIAATYTAMLVYVTTFALLPGAAPIMVTSTFLGIVITASVCSCFSGNSSIS